LTILGTSLFDICHFTPQVTRNRKKHPVFLCETNLPSIEQPNMMALPLLRELHQAPCLIN